MESGGFGKQLLVVKQQGSYSFNRKVYLCKDPVHKIDRHLK